MPSKQLNIEIQALVCILFIDAVVAVTCARVLSCFCFLEPWHSLYAVTAVFCGQSTVQQ